MGCSGDSALVTDSVSMAVECSCVEGAAGRSAEVPGFGALMSMAM